MSATSPLPAGDPQHLPPCAWRAQLGSHIQPQQALAVLDLQERHCTLCLTEGIDGHRGEVVHYMQPGLGLLSRRTFKKSMPTEAQLEQAIMLVEDAIVPLARLIPQHTVLVTCHPLLREIAADGPAHSTASPTEHVLTRDAVEQHFHALVAHASRPQQRPPGLPGSPRAAAALLLLREMLHHWQMHAIRVLPAPCAPASGLMKPAH